jgi:hypothetical protein
MRVVIVFPNGVHPELCAELQKVAPRHRAERLRMLATVGLFIVPGHTTLGSVPTELNDGKPPAKPVHRKSPAASNLIERLKDSLT